MKLNGTKIFESPKIKYLGVILNPFFRWNHHINELSKKLNPAIGMIYKINNDCTKCVLLSLYFSLFHSHLSYGLSAWGTSNDGYISKLELQQKKVVRAITFSDFDHHSLPDSLASIFTRREEIHTLNLRDTNNNKLYTAHHFNNRYGYD